MQNAIRSASKIPSVDRFLVVLTVLSEVLRAYPWLLLFSSFSIVNWTAPPISFLSALIIISAVTLILRLTLSHGLSLAEVRIAALSTGVILVLLTTRLEMHGSYRIWDIGWFNFASTMLVPIFAALLLGLFLVWRGIVTAREELHTDYLYKNFVIGVVGFVILMIIWALTLKVNTNTQLFRTLVPYILGYFFTSLIGMGLSNFLSLRKGMATRPKATELFTRRWLLILLSVVMVILVIGSLIASTISSNLMALIINPLNVLAGWLATAFLYVIGYPLGYLVEGVYWLGQIIINWLMSLFTAQPFQQIESIEFGDTTQKIQTGNFPEGLMILLKWILILAVVSLIVYFLTKAIFRYWRGPQEKGYEEVNESLWSWKGFGADVRAFMKNLTDRFHPGGVHVTPPLASAITEPRYLDIREIYRGLLWEGNRSGLPRARSQTPYEYQSYLAARFEDQKVPLTAITSAYVGDRYGEVKPENEENDLTLVRWWLELRAALRSIRAGSEE
jgi:hypothetical protein